MRSGVDVNHNPRDQTHQDQDPNIFEKNVNCLSCFEVRGTRRVWPISTLLGTNHAGSGFPAGRH